MKRIFGWGFVAFLFPFPSLGVLPDPVVVVVARDAHTKRWERSVQESLPNGRVVTRKSGYTEFAVGMHYLKEAVWTESRELVELFEDGAIARQGQIQAKHSVISNCLLCRAALSSA
jgi:hypothetical protein